MKLKVKILNFSAGKPVCMINEKTAEKISLHVGNRVSIEKKDKKAISIVDISQGLNPEVIGVSNEIVKTLNLKAGENIEVKIVSKPHSIELIKKKIKGQELKKQEIQEVVNDISKNALTDAEIAFFISAINDRGMSFKETKNFVHAMVKSGKRLRLRGKVADKHSFGGVAGNRTTPIIISICSNENLVMPKTSSRAITSAAGTADTIETLAKVDFSIKQIKKILSKTNACFVWGGTLGLAPTDDKIIRVGRIVKIDPISQALASILSKKISVDSKYILIDIPYGRSAKLGKHKAEKLKRKFIKLGKIFNLDIEVVLTNGSEPIGRGVGPILEMRDIIKVLKKEKDMPEDLEKKSIMLSGMLLEMTGKAKKGKGEELAQEILDSGKAWKKFQEIIKAQQGKIKKLIPGKLTHKIKAKRNLKISHINNKLINSLARTAGCPEDKAAGIYLNKIKGESAKKGEIIMTIHATSEEKLKHATSFYNKNKKGMIEFR